MEEKDTRPVGRTYSESGVQGGPLWDPVWACWGSRIIATPPAQPGERAAEH